MIKGIGLDLLELGRIEDSIRKGDRLAKRVLTEREMAMYQDMSERRKLEFLAGRFAAKEAFSKAVGTGVSKEIGFQDIEILPNDIGAPYLTAMGFGSANIFLSITHTEHYAAAQVVIEQ